MPFGTPPLTAVALVSVTQLLPCAERPQQAYETLAKKAAEGKCTAVYNALSESSQEQLTTYLEIMVGMAFAAHDDAAGGLPAVSDYQPGPQLAKAMLAALAEPEEPADAGVADAAIGSAPASDTAPEPSKTDTEPDPLEELRELRGKALWKALCRKKMPPLAPLFREAVLTDFTPLPIRGEAIDGDEAKLRIKIDQKEPQKGKKGKKKDRKKENKDSAPAVTMLKERGKWRLLLEPMGLQWYATEEGRRVPRFHSPILSLGVEPDGKRTPTRAYEHVVQHVRAGNCEQFYAGLDSSSRARMERVVPMMIGFASAIGSTDRRPARDGRSLVLAMCRRASPADLKASGVHLGKVIEEVVDGNRAVLTVQNAEADAATRQVLMIREAGEWRMSIDAFSTNPATAEDTDEEGEEEEE